MDFASLGLSENIVKAVTEAGYTEPTAVQQAAIPAALAGKDLIVSSQTGSGKTAAFMLPSLQRLTLEPTIKARGPRVLVLTPTRELAVQVTDACKGYGKNLRYAKAVSVVGGMPYPVQNKLLSSPYEILVATPGRLMDQMNSGRIDFGRLEILILDEADRMLDMGFVDDIEAIVAKLP
ncbi:DEAD/DEAH box helicase, partial [Zoogloea sp.]